MKKACENDKRNENPSTVLFSFFSLLSGSIEGPPVPPAREPGPKRWPQERRRREKKGKVQRCYDLSDAHHRSSETHSCLVPPPPPPPPPAPPARHGRVLDAVRGRA